jgi:hypothetical protein
MMADMERSEVGWRASLELAISNDILCLAFRLGEI